MDYTVYAKQNEETEPQEFTLYAADEAELEWLKQVIWLDSKWIIVSIQPAA